MTRDLQEQLQQSLGDAYRIERELGGGGMSRVFVAEETALHRQVVVKVLLPELAAGVSVERFRREIHLAAQLQHPHIVQLLSAGTSAGLPYFTMPYVDGESLRARLLRERELPVPVAVRVLRDVAAALAYAHARGVVHRDIKPDNVLLSHGVAVVTDFGVAKALTVSSGPGASSRSTGLTSLGITLGTPAYMAPEQAAGDPGMDHRVDIYAFGIMAYEILTGEPPFTGASPQAVLGAHMVGLPKPVALQRPGIPPLLAHLVMKCLEKRPADRPQTADDIMGTLDMLSTPSGTVPATAALPGARTAGWRRSLGDLVRRWGAAAAIVVLTGAVALLAWPRRGVIPPTPQADGPPADAAPPPRSGSTPAASVGTVPAQVPAAAPLPVPPAPPVVEPAPPAAARAPAPRRTPAPLREPRGEPPARAVSTEDSALLARLEGQAAAARSRAVAAGVGGAVIARGDSSISRAESLAAARRVAEAAVAFSSATALWSAATDQAQSATADRAAAGQRPPAESAPPQRAAPGRPTGDPAAAGAPAAPPPQAPPTADTIAPSTPDDARQITALFDRYAAAIEARDLDAIRRAYPGLLPAQAREWQEFFQSVTDIEVELGVAGLTVKGDAAEARLEGVYVFRNPSTRRTQREPVSFQATLRREGPRWFIGALR